MSSPLIIVPSLGQSVLYMTDANGVRTKKAWPFELDTEALMNELKGSLMKLMLFRTDGGFSDRIASIASDIFEPFALDSDGERLHNIEAAEIRASYAQCNQDQKGFIDKMISAEKIAEKIGKEKLFYFAYDFLASPQKTAKALADYIEFVKTEAGAEKVSLAVCGTGGAVVKAYMSAFAGRNCLEKVVFVSASLDGLTLAADLIENKLKLDNPAELLSSLGGKAASLASVTSMLPPDVMNSIITKTLAQAQNKIVKNSALVWSLVPVARFNEAFASANLSASLAEKVKGANEFSRVFAPCINCCITGGTVVSFLCGSGKALPPVASRSGDSDGITDVFSSSLGGAFPENTVCLENKGVKEILESDEFLSLL